MLNAVLDLVHALPRAFSHSLLDCLSTSLQLYHRSKGQVTESRGETDCLQKLYCGVDSLQETKPSMYMSIVSRQASEELDYDEYGSDDEEDDEEVTATFPCIDPCSLAHS